MGKIYAIILDGAADRPIKELGNKTPLEVAKKPIIDNLAQKGCQSLITIIDDKHAPESDSGTLALMSYDPLKYYPGRGTLEGMGSGLTLGYKYHVSFRINFASYDSKNGCLDRRTARDLSNDELQKLAEEIRGGVLDKNKCVEFRIIAFGRHRGILSLVSNKVKLSGNVSNTDPGFQKEGCFSVPISNYEKRPLLCKPLDDSEAAKKTAYYINKFVELSHEILERSEVNRKRRASRKKVANCILVRDGGESTKEWPLFKDKYKWSLMMFGQLPSEKAIAQLIGAEFTYTKALELQLDERYLIKIADDLAMDSHDVVYIHLKGPDEPAHDQKPLEKVKAIEKIDYYFMRELVKYLSEDDIVIVTCDHATPCELGIHSSDKVPLLICSSIIKPDNREKYSEKDAALGNCVINKAEQIFPYLRHIENEKGT